MMNGGGILLILLGLGSDYGVFRSFQIKREKNRPTSKAINTLVKKVQKQLDDYEEDELVTAFTSKGLKLQKVVIVFCGWEMVYCQKY